MYIRTCNAHMHTYEPCDRDWHQHQWEHQHKRGARLPCECCHTEWVRVWVWVSVWKREGEWVRKREERWKPHVRFFKQLKCLGNTRPPGCGVFLTSTWEETSHCGQEHWYCTLDGCTAGPNGRCLTWGQRGGGEIRIKHGCTNVCTSQTGVGVYLCLSLCVRVCLCVCLSVPVCCSSVHVSLH